MARCNVFKMMGLIMINIYMYIAEKIEYAFLNGIKSLNQTTSVKKNVFKPKYTYLVKTCFICYVKVITLNST